MAVLDFAVSEGADIRACSTDADAPAPNRARAKRMYGRSASMLAEMHAEERAQMDRRHARERDAMLHRQKREMDPVAQAVRETKILFGLPLDDSEEPIPS